MLARMVAVRSAWMASVVAALGCGPSLATDPSGADDSTSASSGADTQGTMTTIDATTLDATTVDPTIGSDVATTIDPSTSGESDASSSSDGSFIMEPDWGGTACSLVLACDVWAQDCPRGEKCIPWSADGDDLLDGCLIPRCSRLDPDPVQPGDTCTMRDGPWSGVDDCEIGSFCWDVDPQTNEGTCVANCSGSEANPICEGDLTCFFGYDGWITACVPGCDPLAPECADGMTCTSRQYDAAVCLPLSLVLPAAPSEACDSSVGCGAGFVCLPSDRVADCGDVGSCCTALCDPAMPACAAEVPVCTPLGDNAAVGGCTID